MSIREDLINEIVEEIRIIAKNALEKEDNEGAIINSVPLEKVIQAGLTIDQLEEKINSYDDINIRIIRQNQGIAIPIVMFEILKNECCNPECKNCTCVKHVDEINN